MSGILSSRHPDPAKPNGHGTLHLVVCLSEKMSPAECNYGIGDKELLAIIACLEKWHMYLHYLQKRFMAYVDHTAYQDIAGFLPAYMDLSTRIWIFFSSPCLVGFPRAFNFFLSSSGFRSDLRFLPWLFGLRSYFLFVPLLIWLSPPPFLSWIFRQTPLNSIYNS